MAVAEVEFVDPREPVAVSCDPLLDCVTNSVLVYLMWFLKLYY